MAQGLRQFVPPILRPFIRRLLRHLAPVRIGGGAQLPGMSNDSYRVNFRRVQAGGEFYFVPAYAINRPACQAILSGHYYEPLTHRLIQDLLNARTGDLIHAGTFFGDMLPSFSHSCAGTVYAFEPVLENYVLAKLSIEENDLDNVLIFNAGLGSELSAIRIDTGGEMGAHYGGGSRIAEAGQRTLMMTIDSLGLQSVSVLQLDVEGSELEALRGGVRTIKGSEPTILIEDNLGNCEPFLRSLSYVPVGSIPGLDLWATEASAVRIRNIVQDVVGDARTGPPEA